MTQYIDTDSPESILTAVVFRTPGTTTLSSSLHPTANLEDADLLRAVAQVAGQAIRLVAGRQGDTPGLTQDDVQAVVQGALETHITDNLAAMLGGQR